MVALQKKRTLFIIRNLRLLNKIENFTLPASRIRQANVLRKLLFIYCIFNFFQLLPLIETFYGEASLIATQNLTGFTLTTLVNLLSVESLKNYYFLFFIVQLLFSFLGLFGFYSRLSTFLVFFTTINLQNRIYSTVSGGDILLCLMLFYLSFISNGKELKNKDLNSIQNAFDKIFICLCKIQFVIIYAVSAIYKLQSAEWLHGTALQQVLLVDEYSLPILQKAVCAAPFLFKILTWAALLYQILLPFLIFVKPIKRYVIVTGLIFHLFIAIGLGLFNFSLVMICCYVLFLDFRERISRENPILS